MFGCPFAGSAAKSPFENAPATILATNFEETVDTYFKLFKERMSLKIDKPYDEKANEEIKQANELTKKNRNKIICFSVMAFILACTIIGLILYFTVFKKSS